MATAKVAAECALGIKAPNKDEIDRTLEKVDLLAYKERHPLSLSGGQMQRLAVAWASLPTPTACSRSLRPARRKA